MEKLKEYIIEYEEKPSIVFGFIIFIAGVIFFLVLINNLDAINSSEPQLMPILGFLFLLGNSAWFIVSGFMEINNGSKSQEGQMITQTKDIICKRIISIRERVVPSAPKVMKIKYKEIKFG